MAVIYEGSPAIRPEAQVQFAGYTVRIRSLSVKRAPCINAVLTNLKGTSKPVVAAEQPRRRQAKMVLSD